MLRCSGPEAIARVLGGFAVLFAAAFFAAQPAGQATADEPPPFPGLAFPFAEGKPWRVTCAYADDEQCGHPDNQWNRYALDMQHGDGPSAAKRQPVVAAAHGTVTIAEWGGDDSFGWYVKIDHGDGYETVYAHFESPPHVAAGREVEQGDILGDVGCTGRCTGPHVHFVLLYKGESVRPEPICGQTEIAAGQFHSGCVEQRSVRFVPATAGDATCDGATDSVDAAVVLQLNAALLTSLLCAHAADVNWDDAADVIDAALILQYGAGLLPTLDRGLWSTGPPMPEARSDIASAVVDGVVYLIGGIGAEGAVRDEVAIYVTKEDRWSKVASLPATLTNTAAASIDGRIYVFGGYREPAEGAISPAVYEYDPLTNKWNERGEMPLPRASAAAVAVDGVVYVLGGAGPKAEVPLAYDPATDEWSELTPMDAPRERIAAAPLDGLIYVAGGSGSEGKSLQTFAAYDPQADAWDTLEPMPAARNGAAAVAFEGRIHIVGGAGPGGAPFAQHAVYTPKTKAWRLAPALPTPRHGLAAQVIEGALYVIGGSGDAEPPMSDAVDVFTVEPKSEAQPASIPLIRQR